MYYLVTGSNHKTKIFVAPNCFIIKRFYLTQSKHEFKNNLIRFDHLLTFKYRIV